MLATSVPGVTARSRALLRVLLALDLAVLVWLVWTPAAAHACTPATPLPWLLCSTSPALHYAQNLLLLVPTAGLIALLWPQADRRRLGLAMLGLTVTIEVVQRWVPGRDPDPYDVVTNALGAWLAVAALDAWTRRRGGHRPSRRDHR